MPGTEWMYRWIGGVLWERRTVTHTSDCRSSCCLRPVGDMPPAVAEFVATIPRPAVSTEPDAVRRERLKEEVVAYHSGWATGSSLDALVAAIERLYGAGELDETPLRGDDVPLPVVGERLTSEGARLLLWRGYSAQQHAPEEWTTNPSMTLAVRLSPFYQHCAMELYPVPPSGQLPVPGIPYPEDKS